MTEAKFSYVFGPVMSRRLGRSLGVDVVSFKSCTYDCVYCQLGRTTHLTTERREYVPLEQVLDEIRKKVASGVGIDYITIAGSGEPTLHSRLGELIAGIKKMTRIPVAVLTNGALFGDPEVQESLLDADVVVPNLDAADAASFARVNRPCPGISFEGMVEGLVAFRKRFAGEIWLEVFLLHGITDTNGQIAKFAGIIRRIQPDRVQLNTVARPAPGFEVEPVPLETMQRIAGKIGFDAEVVAHYETTTRLTNAVINEQDVLAVIRRHPCTANDIAIGLGADIQQVASLVNALLQRDLVHAEIDRGETFYLAQGMPEA